MRAFTDAGSNAGIVQTQQVHIIGSENSHRSACAMASLMPKIFNRSTLTQRSYRRVVSIMIRILNNNLFRGCSWCRAVSTE